ncbi:MAG TPA: FAD-dependent oxidoreductase [Gemmatimonadales bacterium]|nr:FAD-dependent oxidoreductase [Gemmatimonadales bacterium]
MSALPGSADVVIVGGGVIGASVAWRLAQRGWHNVVVLERGDHPGTGSTGRATGGFRCTFATDTNVRLSLRSRDLLGRFTEETGVDSGYRPVGYLWLAESADTLGTMRQALEVQHAAGLSESRELSPGDIAELVPWATLDHLAGALWCPTDGYITPLQVLRGFTDAASRAGVSFCYGVEQTGFEMKGDRIVAVRTSRGSIGCGTVVNAAGAWAAAVASGAGVTIPVSPLRRQVAMTVPTDVLPDAVPMTIWADDGFHLRWREGRVLYAWPTPGDPDDPWSMTVEESWLDQVNAAARRRAPNVGAIPLDRSHCWGGLYETTPDKLAILGTAPGCDNLLLVNGCSGHGVMHSPALGEAAAALLSCEAPVVPIADLSPTRFDNPAAWTPRENL